MKKLINVRTMFFVIIIAAAVVIISFVFSADTENSNAKTPDQEAALQLSMEVQKTRGDLQSKMGKDSIYPLYYSMKSEETVIMLI